MSVSDKPRPAKAQSKTSDRGSAAAATARAKLGSDRVELVAVALIGAAVGAAAALMAAGPTRRPIVRSAKRGARRSAALGAAALDTLPGREAAGAVREYLETARGAIDRAVDEELRDLRRAVRRQRKRIGV
jgi:hypothetical protein